MRGDGLEPDCVTYNTVIRAFAMEKDIHSAYHVLDEMRGCGVTPNVVTYKEQKMDLKKFFVRLLSAQCRLTEVEFGAMAE